MVAHEQERSSVGATTQLMSELYAMPICKWTIECRMLWPLAIANVHLAPL